MTSNTVSTTTNTRDRIKPEDYTIEIYDYLRIFFTENLSDIRDNWRLLKTDTFFDLCIGNIDTAQWDLPEMRDWLNRRKGKIQKAKTYQKKIDLLREFLEDYRMFFMIPKTNLSWSIQTMVADILTENPT
jgi:hypothetical protein